MASNPQKHCSEFKTHVSFNLWRWIIKWSKRIVWETVDFLTTGTITYDGTNYTWEVTKGHLDFGFGDCTDRTYLGGGPASSFLDASKKVADVMNAKEKL